MKFLAKTLIRICLTIGLTVMSLLATFITIYFLSGVMMPTIALVAVVTLITMTGVVAWSLPIPDLSDDPEEVKLEEEKAQ